MREFFNFKRVISLIAVVCFLTTNAMAMPSQALDGGWRMADIDKIKTISIPSGLGNIVETYTAPRMDGERRLPAGQAGMAENQTPSAILHPSPKVVIYIQDAHDSLEAQENIAAMVRQFVKEYGVRTVYEEGYEGPVPTDELFGHIKEPALKEKVSYYLMDKLRVGGAEYAYINRATQSLDRETPNGERQTIRSPGTDFDLIGADSITLHLENIRAYEQSTKKRGDVIRDIQRIRKELQKLIDRDFPKEMKEWLKLKDRYQSGKLPLVEYLQRTYKIRKTGNGERETKTFDVTRSPFPGINAILSNNPTELKKIDLTTLIKEIKRMEEEIVAKGLPSERGQKTFGYFQSILLLEKLNSIQLSAEEYTVLKSSLESLKTEDVADFIARQSRHSIVLFRSWEELITDSINFYELAKKRDESISKIFDEFLNEENGERRTGNGKREAKALAVSRSPSPAPAVLVFGGFHKEAIKRILKEKGISYVILSPSIGAPSKRHEDYYRMLMSGGQYAFEREQDGGNRNTRLDPPSTIHGNNVARESTCPQRITTLENGADIVSRLSDVGAPFQKETRENFILKMDQSLTADNRQQTTDQTEIRSEAREGMPVVPEVEIYPEHHSAFYQIHNAVRDGRIPAGLPLVLFDYHSDNGAMEELRNSEDWVNMANWVGHIWREGTASHVFWVYPHEGRLLLKSEHHFKGMGSDWKELLLKQLPLLKKGVVLSFDMDYFARTPAVGQKEFQPEPGEIKERFTEIFQFLKQNEIPVYLVNGAYSSPLYAPSRFNKEFHDALFEAVETLNADRLVARVTLDANLRLVIPAKWKEWRSRAGQEVALIPGNEPNRFEIWVPEKLDQLSRDKKGELLQTLPGKRLLRMRGSTRFRREISAQGRISVGFDEQLFINQKGFQPGAEVLLQNHGDHITVTLETVAKRLDGSVVRPEWDTPIRKMLEQGYAFCPEKVRENGFVYRAIGKGLKQGLLSGQFDSQGDFLWTGEDRSERDLGIYYVSHGAGEAAAYVYWDEVAQKEGFLKDGDDRAVLVIPGSFLNEEIRSGRAAIHQNEIGMYRFPFFSKPIPASKTPFILVSSKLYKELEDIRSGKKLLSPEDAKLRRILNEKQAPRFIPWPTVRSKNMKGLWEDWHDEVLEKNGVNFSDNQTVFSKIFPQAVRSEARGQDDEDEAVVKRAEKKVSRSKEELQRTELLKRDLFLINQADELADYVQMLVSRINKAAQGGSKVSLSDIIREPQKHEQDFYRPLYALFLARLSLDFDGAEDFVAYGRALLATKGVQALRDAMEQPDAPGNVGLKDFRKIKAGKNTSRASIDFYGQLLFFLTTDLDESFGYLYDELIKTRPRIAIAREGVSYHSRAESTIRLRDKGILYGDEKASAKYQEVRDSSFDQTTVDKEGRRNGPHAAKIAKAIAYWKEQAEKLGSQVLKERIADFEVSAVVVEFDSNLPFIIADVERNVGRVLHTERLTHALNFSAAYLESLDIDDPQDMKELAVWLNVGQEWLGIYRDMVGDFSGAALRGEIAAFVEEERAKINLNFFDIEDSGLIPVEAQRERWPVGATKPTLEQRLAARMKEHALKRYKGFLKSVIEESEKAEDFFAKGLELQAKDPQARGTVEGRYSAREAFASARVIYRKLLNRYEAMGMRAHAHATFHKLVYTTAGIQLYDFGGLMPYHVGMELIFTALRLGLWDDFFNELEIAWTGRPDPERGISKSILQGKLRAGYPRKLTAFNVEESKNMLSQEWFSTKLKSVMKAQLLATPPDLFAEREHYEERANELLATPPLSTLKPEDVDPDYFPDDDTTRAEVREKEEVQEPGRTEEEPEIGQAIRDKIETWLKNKNGELRRKSPDFRLFSYLLDKVSLPLSHKIVYLFMGTLFAISGPFVESSKFFVIPAIAIALPPLLAVPISIVLGLWMGSILRNLLIVLPMRALSRSFLKQPLRIKSMVKWNFVPFAGAFGSVIGQLWTILREQYRGYEGVSFWTLKNLNRVISRWFESGNTRLPENVLGELSLLSPDLTFQVLDFQHQHRDAWGNKRMKVRRAAHNYPGLQRKIQNVWPSLFIGDEEEYEDLRQIVVHEVEPKILGRISAERKLKIEREIEKKIRPQVKQEIERNLSKETKQKARKVLEGLISQEIAQRVHTRIQKRIQNAVRREAEKLPFYRFDVQVYLLARAASEDPNPGTAGKIDPSTFFKPLFENDPAAEQVRRGTGNGEREAEKSRSEMHQNPVGFGTSSALPGSARSEMREDGLETDPFGTKLSSGSAQYNLANDPERPWRVWNASGDFSRYGAWWNATRSLFHAYQTEFDRKPVSKKAQEILWNLKGRRSGDLFRIAQMRNEKIRGKIERLKLDLLRTESDDLIKNAKGFRRLRWLHDEPELQGILPQAEALNRIAGEKRQDVSGMEKALAKIEERLSRAEAFLELLAAYQNEYFQARFRDPAMDHAKAREKAFVEVLTDRSAGDDLKLLFFQFVYLSRDSDADAFQWISKAIATTAKKNNPDQMLLALDFQLIPSAIGKIAPALIRDTLIRRLNGEPAVAKTAQGKEQSRSEVRTDKDQQKKSEDESRFSEKKQEKAEATDKPVIDTRMFDLVVTPILIVLAAPVLLVAMFLIARATDQPVFLAQERVGFKRKLFKVYKLRTLGSEEEPLKLGVFPLGKILRKSGIDEFPQLWNILKGEMALLGPRPLLADNILAKEYLQQVSDKRLPGLLSLWMAKIGAGKKLGADGIRKIIEYNRYEIDHWSSFLILRIAIETVWRLALDLFGARNPFLENIFTEKEIRSETEDLTGREDMSAAAQGEHNSEGQAERERKRIIKERVQAIIKERRAQMPFSVRGKLFQVDAFVLKIVNEFRGIIQSPYLRHLFVPALSKVRNASELFNEKNWREKTAAILEGLSEAQSLADEIADNYQKETLVQWASKTMDHVEQQPEESQKGMGNLYMAAKEISKDPVKCAAQVLAFKEKLDQNADEIRNLLTQIRSEMRGQNGFQSLDDSLQAEALALWFKPGSHEPEEVRVAPSAKQDEEGTLGEVGKKLKTLYEAIDAEIRKYYFKRLEKGIFIPTPLESIDESLEFVRGIRPEAATFYEFGSGDGRVSLLAASKGWFAEGVEHDQGLVTISDRMEQKAVDEGLIPDGQASFSQGDAMAKDFSAYDIIFVTDSDGFEHQAFQDKVNREAKENALIVMNHPKKPLKGLRPLRPWFWAKPKWLGEAEGQVAIYQPKLPKYRSEVRQNETGELKESTEAKDEAGSALLEKISRNPVIYDKTGIAYKLEVISISQGRFAIRVNALQEPAKRGDWLLRNRIEGVSGRFELGEYYGVQFGGPSTVGIVLIDKQKEGWRMGVVDFNPVRGEGVYSATMERFIDLVSAGTIIHMDAIAEPETFNTLDAYGDFFTTPLGKPFAGKMIVDEISRDDFGPHSIALRKTDASFIKKVLGAGKTDIKRSAEVLWENAKVPSVNRPVAQAADAKTNKHETVSEKVDRSFREFSEVFQRQIAIAQKSAEAGKWENVSPALRVISDRYILFLKDPDLKFLHEMLGDSFGSVIGATEAIIHYELVATPLVKEWTLLDIVKMVAAFKELVKLHQVGRLSDWKKARGASGVLDASRVLNPKINATPIAAPLDKKSPEREQANIQELAVDIRAMGLMQVFHRLALAVNYFRYEEAGSTLGDIWKRAWVKVQAERPRYYHDLLAEVARRVQMPLPDGWNEDDGRSLINRLAFNESMYFAKMKGAVQEHLKSMPREAVQSVRELRLWDALYNSVSGEFRVVKVRVGDGLMATSDGVDSGSSASLRNDKQMSNWYKVSDRDDMASAGARPEGGTSQLKVDVAVQENTSGSHQNGAVVHETSLPAPDKKRSEARLSVDQVGANRRPIVSQQTVRTAIENLKGKFTIMADMADVAAFTSKQLEEFEVMAHLQPNVKFVFYGDDERSSPAGEMKKRLEQLQRELGMDRVLITRAGAEDISLNKGVKVIQISKGSQTLFPRTRNGVYRGRYLSEEVGIVAAMLLYADQHEKPSEKGTMDLSMVNAMLRAELQEFQNSIVFARAA